MHNITTERCKTRLLFFVFFIYFQLRKVVFLLRWLAPPALTLACADHQQSQIEKMSETILKRSSLSACSIDLYIFFSSETHTLLPVYVPNSR
jgi:hypothetical protein